MKDLQRAASGKWQAGRASPGWNRGPVLGVQPSKRIALIACIGNAVRIRTCIGIPCPISHIPGLGQVRHRAWYSACWVVQVAGMSMR